MVGTETVKEDLYAPIETTWARDLGKLNRAVKTPLTLETIPDSSRDLLFVGAMMLN